ncbi:cobalt-precorrin-6A reductase [Asaia spathodeae]|uniref:cobalt-precorrin-6A reductase n=1 Tax=Asaia spathodeae TaxID=657016 RepID=UPI002FC32642
MQILILGGTSEARQLCQALESRHGHHIIFSLAGVTNSALPVPSEKRIGGFGGVDGLTTYLGANGIDAVIDATHPFAAQMSRHAVEAATRCALPLLRLSRPAWQAPPGARWRHVDSIDAVPAVLGETPRHVFLTTGRKDLAPFMMTPHRYLLRSIETPTLSLPPRTTLILARGPFSLDDEIALMTQHGIECLVTKNAGSDATAAKLDAARQLDLEVIMVDRPVLPPAQECESVGEALDWVAQNARQGTRRSV